MHVALDEGVFCSAKVDRLREREFATELGGRDGEETDEEAWHRYGGVRAPRAAETSSQPVLAWFSSGKLARALAPRQMHCCTTLERHRGARRRARRE